MLWCLQLNIIVIVLTTCVLLYCFIKLKLMQNNFTEDDFCRLYHELHRVELLLFAYYRHLREVNASFFIRDFVRGFALLVRSLRRNEEFIF